MSYDDLLIQEQKLIKLSKLKRLLPLFMIAHVVFFTIISIILVFATEDNGWCGLLLLIPFCLIYMLIINNKYKNQYNVMYYGIKNHILSLLKLKDWMYKKEYDSVVHLRSGRAVDNYEDIDYFKEYSWRIQDAYGVLTDKQEYEQKIKQFLKKSEYKVFSLFHLIENELYDNLRNTKSFNVLVEYTSPAGRSHNNKLLHIYMYRIKEIMNDETILMTKAELTKYLKEHEKELLAEKQKKYYDLINKNIDYAASIKDSLIIKEDGDELDKLYDTLMSESFAPIKKIKSSDDEQWTFVEKKIKDIENKINEIARKNRELLYYYNSEDFAKIKNACDQLMSREREFNEYIEEKVKSISSLFGRRVVREETIYEDEYNYSHPYKKTISPFAVELSSSVYSSAENNPIDYIIKYFYPDKEQYPEQIQKLQLLIEELETLKEAKEIIDNYKKEIEQYLDEVPSFVMSYDEDGFYSRLGFAIVDEKSLTVTYWFSYTSDGGKTKRSFPVEMKEETIVDIIKKLESKLTISAFTKEQRSLMTSKLRSFIKERDNFTCRICGNSTYKEQNLLLEIDHIVPVSKGGCTVENNLQTLCWKCNRQKSNKII